MDSHTIVSEPTKGRPPYGLFPSPDLFPNPDLFPGDAIEAVKQQPETHNPFNEKGEAPTCMAQPVLATIAAIQNAASGRKGWLPAEPENGRGPTFIHENKRGSTVINVELNPTDGTHPLGRPLGDALWEQLGQFDERDADVFLIVIAYLAASEDKETWIYIPNILDHRGLEPRMQRDAPHLPKRRAGHREEDALECSQALRRLSSIRLKFKLPINTETTVGKNGRQRKSKQKLYDYSGSLLYLLDTWKEFEKDTETGEWGPFPRAIWMKVKTCEWLETFLQFPNRQVANTCHALFEYAPNNELWAKRLGYYIFFHGHMNGQRVLSRTVGMLIKDSNLEIEDGRPQRTRDRFEKALNLLKTDGVIAGWKYTVDIKQTKNWFNVWLNQYVEINTVSRRVVAQDADSTKQLS